VGGPEGPLWSERQGRGPVVNLDSAGIRRVFGATVSVFERRGWFQEFFGYQCIDSGFVPGRLGEDVQSELLIQTGRANIWPVTSNAAKWDDDTLFDMLEFLYRCVSAGIEESARYHTFGGCGVHFTHFNQTTGRAEYRDKVNRALARYGDGFELTGTGQVERRLPKQVAELATPPSGSSPADEVHVAEAIRKYRSRVGLDRRDAVRHLADVLERIRPNVKAQMFSKDEAALFQIANQFWIRHNDPGQQRAYDHDAWWDWLFHLYLSSIRLVQRLSAGSEAPEVEI
jgi:hypothetical protein